MLKAIVLHLIAFTLTWAKDIKAKTVADCLGEFENIFRLELAKLSVLIKKVNYV